MNCPRCNNLIEKVRTEYGLVAMCQSCFGHFLFEKNILQSIPLDKWNKTLNYSKNKTERIVCPSCKSQMDTHSLPEEFNSIQIDRCARCKVIWFDKDKIEELHLQKITKKDADTDQLAKGLLLDIKLDYKKKESERKQPNYDYSDSGSGFGLYDFFSGDSDNSGGD